MEDLDILKFDLAPSQKENKSVQVFMKEKQNLMPGKSVKALTFSFWSWLTKNRMSFHHVFAELEYLSQALTK